ncbi:MAG: DUF2147 domain-containing protein [Flavobacteriia bacterium]|nr:DUF2147 domain-containing protein [Flavobacteriia bacterium]
MLIKNLVLILYFCFLNLNAQSKADHVLGKWLATDHSVAVEVYKLKGEYKAKVIWFDESKGSGKPMHTRTDFENPDPNLRNRKILGMEVLDGLVYNAKTKEWEHGKIYDASSGRLWDSSAHITENGLLKVRGYWKFKWIGKSMTFKKTNYSTLTKL